VADHCQPHPQAARLDFRKLGKSMALAIASLDRRGQSNRRARGEGLGWEFVHVAIDDNSLNASRRSCPEEKRSATTFLNATLAYYQSLGVKVERV